jgi:hypothetical protein
MRPNRQNAVARHAPGRAARAALACLTSVMYVLPAPEAGAQAPADVAAPAVPEYRVELIVFEYTGGVNGGLEDWAYIDTGRAAVTESLQPADDAAGAGVDDAFGADGGSPLSAEEPAPAELLGEPPPQDPGPVQTFELIDPAQYALTDAYTRLRNSPDVRPILHTAWRQPVYGPENASTWNLTSIARPPRQLGGTVSLFVSRYLHLTLDLELAELPTSDAPGAGFGNSVVYRLSEQRNKMRSDEVHFFDHPRLGALAIITRERDSEPEAQPPEAGVETVSR